MATIYRRTPKRDQIFFDGIASGMGINKSCKAAKYNNRTIYDWRKTDPEFAAKWEEAKQTYIEVLESEADRRAVTGVDEPVFYQGKKCGSIRRFSDNLLMFRMKAMAPAKYKDRVENTTHVQGQIDHNHHIESMSDDELNKRIAELEAKLK